MIIIFPIVYYAMKEYDEFYTQIDVEEPRSSVDLLVSY
jgi:hypothetical protein